MQQLIAEFYRVHYSLSLRIHSHVYFPRSFKQIVLAIVGVAIVNVRIRVALRVPALFIRERYFPAMMLVNYCRVICDKGGLFFALIAVGTTSVPKMAPPDKSPTDINFLKYILEEFT